MRYFPLLLAAAAALAALLRSGNALAFMAPRTMVVGRTQLRAEQEDQQQEVLQPPPSGPCPNFPKCSGEYREKGCDGSGRMIGGLGAIPGLGWWPIKAYRPCPSSQMAGYDYSRAGQTLDQVVFGTKGAAGAPVFGRLADDAGSDDDSNNSPPQ